jgi:CheY-like chemotaxis protein
MREDDERTTDEEMARVAVHELARRAPDEAMQRLGVRDLRPRRPRILLAEDDDELRELLAQSLREYGYDVTEARDGTELWAFASWSIASQGSGRAVDMVVTDVRMPGATGIEVLDELRRMDARVRAIVITGAGDERTTAEAHRVGAEVVFDKPFQVDDLLIAVLTLLPPPDDAVRAA